ncbi:retrovirus-related pol polyprotein from transposon tnt 1-94, partial [Nicotiana attenuata]
KVDGTLYRRVIGKIHYLSFTRPDIAFAVSKLSQFMHQPGVSHWKAVKCLLRYLCHTAHLGIKLAKKSAAQLVAYSDSDWAGDPLDRTSITGYVVYLGDSPISWSSKKQRSVSRSSTEAEYRAVAATTSEVVWLKNLLRELHFPLSSSPRILCDNMSTTYICANPAFHSRMKHVEIDFHFVRQLVQSKALEVHHLHAADQVADILTKPLPSSAFLRMYPKLGLVDT